MRFLCENDPTGYSTENKFEGPRGMWGTNQKVPDDEGVLVTSLGGVSERE